MSLPVRSALNEANLDNQTPAALTIFTAASKDRGDAADLVCWDDGTYHILLNGEAVTFLAWPADDIEAALRAYLRMVS